MSQIWKFFSLRTVSYRVSGENEEKTEQPSEFRLKEARRKGQVAKSQDLAALGSLSLAFLGLLVIGQFFLKKISLLWIAVFNQLGQATDSLAMKTYTKQAFMVCLTMSAPVLFLASFGAFLGNVGQFGFLLSSHPLKPDLKRINPILGFKKLFSKNRLVELLKQVTKFSIVLLLIYGAISEKLLNISMLFRVKQSTALFVIADLMLTIVIRVLLGFLIVALFDFFWSRYSFKKSMRMSKYELKKEYKEQEGDPNIKQERRRIHQETLEASSLQEVKDAAVVITNPNHLAVALRYAEGDDVPKVIAKGTGRAAKKIIEEARSHDVHVIRNVPLARDLQWLEINEEIPKNLYDAVAEVITFIYELSAKNSEQQHENNAS